MLRGGEGPAIADIADDVLDATEALLAETNWDDLTLEEIAERAGQSRVTLWRHGVTKDALRAALVERMIEEHRRALWPVMVSGEPAAQRLRRALHALCDTIDAHLGFFRTQAMRFGRMFIYSMEPRPAAGAADAVGEQAPFARLLRDGLADGTLHPTVPPSQAALVLFETVCWAYVRMRTTYRYNPAWARRLVLGLVLHGLGDHGPEDDAP